MVVLGKLRQEDTGLRKEGIKKRNKVVRGLSDSFVDKAPAAKPDDQSSIPGRGTT